MLLLIFAVLAAAMSLHRLAFTGGEGLVFLSGVLVWSSCQITVDGIQSYAQKDFQHAFKRGGLVSCFCGLCDTLVPVIIFSCVLANNRKSTRTSSASRISELSLACSDVYVLPSVYTTFAGRCFAGGRLLGRGMCGLIPFCLGGTYRVGISCLRLISNATRLFLSESDRP